MNPTVCPECGSVLARDGSRNCTNPDCASLVRERIARWCAPDAMNIALSDDFIHQLVARGLLLDVADVYRLRWSELLQFKEMTEALTEALLASIEASKSRNWCRVLYGLGIPGMDATIATLLTEKFKAVEELAAASRVQLAAIDSVSDVVAQNVMRWFSDPQHRKLIKRLRQAGLDLG